MNTVNKTILEKEDLQSGRAITTILGTTLPILGKISIVVNTEEEEKELFIK